MSASFSNAKKTFSQVVNGVTKLVAALFNSAYDEIEAEQTFIGPTGGGALSYTESLTNMLRQYRRGCAVEYKGAADLYVRAGEIMIVDADGNRRLRRNPSDTTVTWADIDTGAEANSTLYYVYAVADASGTTFTVKISVNATTPTGPTFYRLIGIFYNDASGNIQEVGNLPEKLLGMRVVRTDSITYQAKTDGFFIGIITGPNSSAAKMIAYSDASSTPTTVVAHAGYWYYSASAAVSVATNGNSFCVPIKKDDYYKAIMTDSGTNPPTVTYYWQPMS